MKVEFYTRSGCPLCDKGFETLSKLADTYRFTIECYDIYKDDYLLELYQLKIPVVKINGIEADYGQLNKIKLEQMVKYQKGINSF
ncbi:glutaredoxin family protein [Shouchella patagoniensis]|uniref:glutaredoxin family protein n=1 Tax=Shouchella patagoniensis TaxID=228576 RepID=UPI000994C4C3|nr:glutaredoxin family protein [Shouchella patagoniensis]